MLAKKNNGKKKKISLEKLVHSSCDIVEIRVNDKSQHPTRVMSRFKIK